MFKATHPIIGTRDLPRAIDFYTKQLGFELAFDDPNEPKNYVGFRRDTVVVHMQFQYEHEMSTIRLRFLVDDPDAVRDEYVARGVVITNDIKDTPWKTREFSLYDPDGSSLAFYRGV